ncbi:hypothetical protein FB45DRAFT_1067485 [Roridomyces roridus]|uniref:Uncharacterized protein n=1 Tax=Roridomyces roridus TaxID=1738132 RepID=A0AAD7B252_9AGAR|nr:hypothetical protein FB45DRAFT_1067485 [Roridomyces roridus]
MASPKIPRQTPAPLCGKLVDLIVGNLDADLACLTSVQTRKIELLPPPTHDGASSETQGGVPMSSGDVTPRVEHPKTIRILTLPSMRLLRTPRRLGSWQRPELVFHRLCHDHSLPVLIEEMQGSVGERRLHLSARSIRLSPMAFPVSSFLRSQAIFLIRWSLYVSRLEPAGQYPTIVHAINSKPPSFFRFAVGHLLACTTDTDWSLEQTLDILRPRTACRSRNMQVRRMVVPLKQLFGPKQINLTNQGFSSVTHLDVLDSVELPHSDANFVPNLAFLPSLTHFSLNDDIPWSGVRNARVVMMQYKDYWPQWENAASGKSFSFGARAEDFVARKQRGAVERTLLAMAGR